MNYAELYKLLRIRGCTSAEAELCASCFDAVIHSVLSCVATTCLDRSRYEQTFSFISVNIQASQINRTLYYKLLLGEKICATDMFKLNIGQLVGVS